jgi:hypothetical protein
MTQCEKITWVVCGPDPYLATCQRCGQHVAKPPLPAPIDAFIRYLQYACELHRYCQPTSKKKLAKHR